MFPEQTFGSSFVMFVFFIMACFGIIGWRLRQMDSDGKVKNAAKEGLVKIITRLLK